MPINTLQTWQPDNFFPTFTIDGNTLKWSYQNHGTIPSSGSFIPQCTCQGTPPHDGASPEDEYKCKAAQWLIDEALNRFGVSLDWVMATFNDIFDGIAVIMPTETSEAWTVAAGLIFTTYQNWSWPTQYENIETNRNFLVCMVYRALDAAVAKNQLDTWIDNNLGAVPGYLFRRILNQQLINLVFDQPNGVDPILLMAYTGTVCEECPEHVECNCEDCDNVNISPQGWSIPGNQGIYNIGFETTLDNGRHQLLIAKQFQSLQNYEITITLDIEVTLQEGEMFITEEGNSTPYIFPTGTSQTWSTQYETSGYGTIYINLDASQHLRIMCIEVKPVDATCEFDFTQNEQGWADYYKEFHHGIYIPNSGWKMIEYPYDACDNLISLISPIFELGTYDVIVRLDQSYNISNGIAFSYFDAGTDTFEPISTIPGIGQEFSTNLTLTKNSSIAVEICESCLATIQFIRFCPT